MSAVTLTEIADLVADAMRVPVASMRGATKRKPEPAELQRIRTARKVVVLLAWRHTECTAQAMASFFGQPRAVIMQAVDTADGWATYELADTIEAIERLIDVLHDRRHATHARVALTASDPRSARDASAGAALAPGRLAPAPAAKWRRV